MSQNFPNLVNQILATGQGAQFNIAPMNYSNLQQAYQGYNAIPDLATIQAQQNTTLPSNRVLSNEQFRPGVLEALQQQEIANQQARQALGQQLQGGMNTWRPINIEGHPYLTDTANIVPNAIHDVQEIGTGLTYALTHMPELAEQVKDWATSNKSVGEKAGIAYDTVIGDLLGVPLKDTLKGWNYVLKGQAGSKEAKEHARKMWGNLYNEFVDNPLIVSSVVAPNLTGKAVASGIKGAGQLAEKAGIPVGDAAKTVAATIDASKAKYGAQRAGVQEANKVVQKADINDLARVIRNTREGNARVPLNEKQIKLKDDYLKSALEYEKAIDDNALVSSREMAALQYVADVEGKTFQEVRRTLKPQIDALMEGVKDPLIKFSNRLDEFQHEVNSINKSSKTKLNLEDSRKISELVGDEEALFKKHLTDAEYAQMLEADATVGETIQYLRDMTRDSLTGRRYIDRVAKNEAYQNNMRKLAQLAADTGDATLKNFYEGMKLADKGEIFASTFAGADIPAGTTVSEVGRRYQGKSSSREYGTATPEAVAKAYKENIGEFVDDVFRGKVYDDISNNILNGTIDGVNPLVQGGDKNIMYINPENLINGDLGNAVRSASKVEAEGLIPISKSYVDAIDNALLRPESVLKGLWGDTFKAGKQVMLASGNYLGGNFLSGAFGTMINSDGLTGLVSDFVKSVGAKGRLAKELGVYRYTGDAGRYNTALGRGLGQLNLKVGGAFVRDLDASMQNFFAEMNANRVLRQSGEKAFRDVDKIKLAKLIEDVRLSSMMKPTYSVIPTKVQSALGPLQPFINWTDTATQVTYNMYKRHPFLMGAVSADVFGNIGVDQELQNRLGLKVYSDKPFVSYKTDARTGGAKEISVNFLPQMTPLQLLQPPKEIIRSGIPVISPMLAAIQGKNVYGSYMKRTHAGNQFGTRIQGGRRYKVNPRTGRFEPVEGGMADEMISTAVKNLVGPVNLINRTVLPTVAGAISAVTGKDVRYYQPYDQSIFGSFSTNQPDTLAAMLSTGNPAKQRTIMDVISGLGTYYERPYTPNADVITGRQMKSIRRGAARDIRREEYLKNQER